MTKNFPKSMKIIDLISKKLKNNLYTGNMRKMTSSFIIIKLFKTSNKKNTLRCRGKKKKKKTSYIQRKSNNNRTQKRKDNSRCLLRNNAGEGMVDPHL